MDLFEEQKDIEITMANRGLDRYRRVAEEAMASGEATRIKSVQAVMDTAIVEVSCALSAFREEAKSGRAGRRHSAVRLLEGLEEGAVSYIALRITLDGMGSDKPITATACSIGRVLEIEARMLALEKAQGAYVRKLMKDLDARTDHLRHRRAVLSRVLREKGDTWTNWTEKEHLLVGLKMIELISESTGLLTTSVSFDRTTLKGTTVLVATNRFKDWVAGMDNQFGLLSPEYLPCVIPPVDWESNTKGGYHTDALAFPPTLVKTSNRLHREAIAAADMSRVMAAVNAIQRTPWQVNRRVLEVALILHEQGSTVGGLPDWFDTPLPTKPDDIDTNEEARTAWKREAAKTHDRNRRVTGRRLGVLRSLAVAEEFERYDRIYFPHQLDFRGRVYPIPQGFNPQGNDLAKGLLHFADGDPIDTPEAARWFRIHGANCFGVDKVSFDERIQWVEQNARNIVMAAEDPLGFQWWADADSPFCFLAWCFEFNDWLTAGCSPAFVSRVPVAMDGSCNGLQHYSAMLRDARAGAATNLLPSGSPQDIYGEVAKVAMSKLAALSRRDASDMSEDAIWESLMAEAWFNFGIDRKITKRPVMVLPYGGTLRSCMDYVLEAVSDRPDVPFRGEDLLKASAFLAKVVWESIGEVVVSARLAMAWLKSAALKTAKEKKPLIWTTPSGFPVVQAYQAWTDKRIDTFLLGSRFYPTIRVPVQGELDGRKQGSGVAPNFVHSMDAASLILTVLEAKAAGVVNFAMIHDSYGTTAGKTAQLSHALRAAFVGLYEGNDVLTDFLREAVPQTVANDLSDPPFVGGLELMEVMSSPYFFA